MWSDTVSMLKAVARRIEVDEPAGVVAGIPAFQNPARPSLLASPRRPAIGLRALLLALTLGLLPAGQASAGGGPEHALLIIDPSDPDALFLGHRYQQARGIPGSNLIYMQPAAESFEAMVALQGATVEGILASRGLGDRIDAIVVAPGKTFYLPLPAGAVSTGCQVVSRISIGAAYGMLPLADEILAGGLSDQAPNHYYGSRFVDARSEPAFDARTDWLYGRPGEGPSARRYYIGALLGYTGARGNSPAELAAMIDRSAAADASHPEGSFYFMNTSDDLRSRDRRRLWNQTVASIVGMGGKAEVLEGSIPGGRHDALGILTGLTDPKLAGADLGILPGAFADHLTSYAGMFDSGSQGKMSQWITAGASGSAGTIQEPCTGGKFPDPDLHARYLAGMSLGEAWWRSTPWLAMQTLFYGDPLTRPFARPIELSVGNIPEGPASGRIWPVVETSSPSDEARIDRYRVLVDGRSLAIARPGAIFSIDTQDLSDGWHDLRVLAYEDSALRIQSRWLGELLVSNQGRSAELTISRSAGAITDSFRIDARALGGPATELRLLVNDRVIAAAAGDRAAFELPGAAIGPGAVPLQLEARFADGRLARSRPQRVEIAHPGPATAPAPGGAPPQAMGYTRYLEPGAMSLIDLPAFDPEGSPLILEPGSLDASGLSASSAISLSFGAGVLRASVEATARGQASLGFRALEAGPSGQASASANIRLVICPEGDFEAMRILGCPGYRLWLPRLVRE